MAAKVLFKSYSYIKHVKLRELDRNAWETLCPTAQDIPVYFLRIYVRLRISDQINLNFRTTDHGPDLNGLW